MVTAFPTGTDLIIASSQKAGVALSYTRDNDVGLLVDECLKNPDDGTTSVKSNGGKCGEMSAAQIWQRLHPGKPIAAAKILTVSVKEKDGKVIVWAPCSEGDKGGGCDRLVGHGKVMDKEVTKETFDNREPGSEAYSKTGWVPTPLAELSFVAPIQE
ncbi:hypothetical protein BU23DRAFT_554173 [Bimuria novae-zelandiae CBS 107.79]|uniref:Uncharacterized protein n=1 Tax=Bimuria novae-zelandiae CBS 107.79 TaxID=1447943 RepID=A0A6A5V8V7_9PLEO|nr:hypothetical protein BU23DRAFT_554173 [Bimuria novae-zelandiae CBS 107.79]